MLLAVLLLCACVKADSLPEDLQQLRCQATFCERIVCEDATPCPGGRIVPNASNCGCCDACVEEIGEGEPCEKPLLGSLKDIRQPQCKGGLKCVAKQCVIESSESCLSRRKTFGAMRGAHAYAEDLWVPACNEEGHFHAAQKKTKKSVCVTINGTKLFGQDEADLSENMTCACSRHLEKLRERDEDDFMTQPQEHCSSDGSFEPLQCVRDLCYCADAKTGQMTGRIAKMKHRNKLPCYDPKKDSGSYLKPCEKELQRTRSVRQEFRRKGIDILGIEKVRCDPDGTFAAKQCDSAGCACTTENGIEIRSYHTDDHNIQATMKCNCARDVESTATHTQYPTFHCDSWGNYRFFQCLSTNQCFCVDEDGDVISKETNREIAGESFCRVLLRNLTGSDTEIPGTQTLPTVPTFLTSTTEESTDDDYEENYKL